MSEHARKLQEHLIKLGYLDGEPDGIVGKNTLTAFEKLLRDLPKKQTKRKIYVVRYKQTPESTTSVLTIDGSNFKGFILEPKGPSTAQAEQNRRIPTGVYKLSTHNGEKYKNVFLLSNSQVSAARAILIHQGNSPRDTRGCLLIGLAASNNWVSNSNLALNELRKIIADGGGPEAFELVISEQFQ